MGARTERDLTKGSIPRHIVALAGPAILSTIVHNIYGLNDIYFAQFVGLAGQTAVSNNLFTMIAVFGFVQLASVGTLTLVARRTGARNEEGADRAARQGLCFAVAVSCATAVLGHLTAPLIPAAMGMAEEVTRESLRYLRILFSGLPFLFLFPTVESIFRARGDTRTPLLLQIIAVGANIAGNAFAVLVLDTGVAGLATCTILSRLLGAGVGLILLRRGRVGLPLARRSGPLFDTALWTRIVRVSAPIGARTLLFGLIYQIIARIAAPFGTAVQNGLGVGIRIEGMCFFILIGFGLAAGPLVGQNLGAGKPNRAERAAWITALMALVPSLFFSALFFFAPEFLLRIFTEDAQSAAHGADYLRIIAACLVFLDLEVILANAFVGAGDTIPPTLIDVPLTAIRIPLSLWLANGLGLGPSGIWWTISTTCIARGVFMTLWFARGRWKRSRPDLD
jgi:putative MATE family efflux protein